FFAKLGREKYRQNVAKKHSKLYARSGTLHTQSLLAIKIKSIIHSTILICLERY
ncbi:MAG: hypothetical protein ACI8RP_001922, partial [Urechidicola sp.]